MHWHRILICFGCIHFLFAGKNNEYISVFIVVTVILPSTVNVDCVYRDTDNKTIHRKCNA
jgi:hypothetical protein